MPTSKKPAKKRSTDKAKRLPNPKTNRPSNTGSARAEFHAGMTAWLKGNGYQIGITGQDIKGGKEIDWAGALIKYGKELVGTAMPMSADSGGDAETVFQAMLPLLPLADLIGFKIKIGTPILIVVIYADDLEYSAVAERFAKLFELAEPLANLGLRLNGRAMGSVLVCPVVVYSNAEKFSRDVPILTPLGYKKKFMHQAVVDPVYVNLPMEEVVFRETFGVMDSLVQKLNNMLGVKYPIFDRTDLSQLLFLARQPQ
jgi:hypothetical protein